MHKPFFLLIMWLTKQHEHLLVWSTLTSAALWAMFHQVSLLCKEVMPILSVLSGTIYISKMLWEWYRIKHPKNPVK